MSGARSQSPSFDGLENPEISPEVDTSKMLPQGDEVAQNVHFVDNNEGFQDGDSGFVDVLRHEAETPYSDLGDFFSRPVKIHSETWQQGVQLGTTINPWTLFFTNPRVINRIANFKLMSCTLKTKIVINGNPFFYGRLIMAYNPFPLSDDYTRTRLGVNEDIIAASQRPHVYLDPSVSSSGTISCPFFTPYNTNEIPTETWEDMGSLWISTLNVLNHANAAADEDVTITVFAWAEDVILSGLTQANPASMVPQGSEYQLGPVSKISSAVAKAAGQLANIPWIRPYATATEVASSAVTRIAQLFGYCKPTLLEVKQYKPYTKSSIALTAGLDDCNRLSCDPKQELTIDPRALGLSDPTDEMNIAHIASRESYFATFPWSNGEPPERMLFSTVVDPAVHVNRNGTDELHMPACCFASVPFEYWRGTMRYRFMIACSQYHRGRIKIVYDPTAGGATAEYNTAYTKIVDITEDTDFTIDVGWTQPQSYRKVGPVYTAQNDLFYNIVPLDYNSAIQEYGNGTLSVYVVNELTSPNNTTDSVQVNVFVSACPDIEFAAPTGIYLHSFHPVDGNIPGLVRPSPPSFIERFANRKPQGEPVDNHEDEAGAPETPNISKLGAPSESWASPINKVHFGEVITSFREMCKRYQVHEVLPANIEQDPYDSLQEEVQIQWEIVRSILPFEPGLVETSELDFTASIVPKQLDSNFWYAYGYMTLIRYLTLGFGAWRGGMRWAIDGYNYLPYESQVNDTSRSTPVTPRDFYTHITQGNQTEVYQSYHLLNSFATGMDGTNVCAAADNNMHSVEVPYYSNYRFSYGKKRAQFASGPDPVGAIPSFRHARIIEHRKDNPELGPSFNRFQMRTRCAAAEDFSCYMFLGAPVLFYEPIPPIAFP